MQQEGCTGGECSSNVDIYRGSGKPDFCPSCAMHLQPCLIAFGQLMQAEPMNACRDLQHKLDDKEAGSQSESDGGPCQMPYHMYSHPMQAHAGGCIKQKVIWNLATIQDHDWT